MKQFLLLLIMTFLLSCATQPSTKIPTNFDQNSNEGMIIGTIAFKNEKPIFNGYFFYYIGKDDKKTSHNKMININPEQIVKMKFNPNFYDNEKAVYYFSITQPPGDYKFVNLGIFENGGYIQSSQSIPMDISFNIEKGKIKYLGEIYVDYRNQLIILNDEKSRDIPKISNEFPNLKIEH